MAKIDDIDKKILAFLHEDAFLSNKEMATRLGMSATPIHERIKRMEKEGVITGYRAMINPAKLGKTLTVFCDISLKEHAADYLKQFEQDVMQLVEVQECYCVSGQSDFLLKIVVADMDEAIDHITAYSSKHTEAIVTEDYTSAMRFLREVDSASVMVNASTRFADGFEYGLGAEIGISNDKLHARGPVGLEGLTSLKYVVFGHGEVRQ